MGASFIEKEKLVSVIIPTYNTAKHIKEAVDSAVNQTYKSLEIVVVDDGSTDNTKDVLKTYIDNKKIRYIFQENKGPSSARNHGIRESHGDYISFLDADDLYSPEKIQRQIQLLRSHADVEVFVCSPGVFFDNDRSKIFLYKNIKSHLKSIDKMKFGNFININSPLIDRKAIVNHNIYFDESILTAEDWDFWIRLMKAEVKFFFHDDKLIYTRLRKYNSQSNLIKQKKNDIYVFKKNFGAVHFRLYCKLFLAHIYSFFPTNLKQAVINFYRNKLKYKNE